jgi:sugar phosphate permease
VGGIVADRLNWRAAFAISAVPGILIAILIAILMKEPARGASQQMKPRTDEGGGSFSQSVRHSLQTVRVLLRNKAYMSSVLGYAAVTFSLGGISWWMPSFLHRAAGYSLSKAAFVMGAITVVAGLGGTALGGAIAQRWLRTTRKALYLLPAVSSAIAVPPALACFFGQRWFGTTALLLPGLAAAIFLIFLGTGPVNAATVNAVRPEIRATALAGQLFLIHALGDAISPRIIGMVSDHSSLNLGLGSTLVAMLIASFLFFAGARYAPSLQTVTTTA